MASNIPENLKYTSEHEWVRVSDGIATVGITDFAQSSLGDVVYVELPEIGKNVKSNEPFGVVESIKSVSDLYAPVSGSVVAKNSDVEQRPELLNSDCYDNWLIKIKLSNSDEISSLLSAEIYKKKVEG